MKAEEQSCPHGLFTSTQEFSRPMNMILYPFRHSLQMLDPSSGQVDQGFQEIGHDSLTPSGQPKGLERYVALPIEPGIEQVQAVQVGPVLLPPFWVKPCGGSALRTETMARRIGLRMRETAWDEGIRRKGLVWHEAGNRLIFAGRTHRSRETEMGLDTHVPTEDKVVVTTAGVFEPADSRTCPG
jgi:hypothetical protein